jgi:hypothetical protein
LANDEDLQAELEDLVALYRGAAAKGHVVLIG